MPTAKPRILYFFPHPSGFIQKDLDLLAGVYDVRSQSFAIGNKLSVPFRLVQQLAFLLAHIFSASCIVCRFAGYHSLLPVLFAKITGRPSLVIVGGTEAHCFPSIRYGNCTRWLYGKVTGVSLRLASHLAPVDESLVRHPYSYDARFPAEQGLMNLYQNLQTPVTVVHNGYEGNVFFAKPGIERRPLSFLTVGNAGKEFEFYLKGIDMLLTAARRFPMYTFTIAGRSPEWIGKDTYPNVTFTGPAGREALLELYSSHEFYLQLSLAEGFPNALCEAMLCGCIPIGSDVFSIPKIIDGTGFVVKHRTEENVALILESAVRSDRAALSRAASERIAREYPLSKRTAELLGLLKRLQEKKNQA